MSIFGYINFVEPNSVYITTVSIVDTDDTSTGTINSYTRTILNNRVELGNNEYSVVTYEITVKNNDTDSVGFNQILYSTEFYDNENIVCTLYPLSDDPYYGLSK